MAQYYYYPGLWEGGPALHSLINLAKWNELPKSYQAMLRSACEAANCDMMASYDHKNPAAMRSLVANGAQLRPFSQEILAACFEAANATYDEITLSNATFKKVHESQKAFRKDAYLWAQVSEYTYDTFMMHAAARRQALSLSGREKLRSAAPGLSFPSPARQSNFGAVLRSKAGGVSRPPPPGPGTMISILSRSWMFTGSRK